MHSNGYALFFRITAFCILITTSTTHAMNMGVYGAIYPIAEPDMLKAIYARLADMQKNGELAEKNREFKKRAIEHILRPAAVEGVSDLGNLKPTWHYFNPSIEVNHNLTDTLGNIIALKGEQINPLKMIHMKEILYFINGDNEKQIKWIKRKVKIADRMNQKIKIILVNGNIKTTSKALNHRIYFDQKGKLCEKFKIKHTPTVVYQPISHGIILPRLIVKEVRDV